RRHGFGQYFMGTDPLYFTATAVFRSVEPPFILGGVSMMQGFFGAMLRRDRQLDDPELRKFIRAYQRKTLFQGRARAMSDTEADRVSLFEARSQA
ncbi:MAG: glycosyl transferase family 2, partial [Pseudomonadota bacterium]